MNAYQTVAYYINLVYQWLLGNPTFVAGALAMLTFIIAVHLFNTYDAHKHQKKINAVRGNMRERWMTTPERENQLKVLMSDGICEVIEDLIAQKKMTDEEGVIWYRRYGNLLNLPDLLSKHEVKLKEQLRKSIKLNKKVIPFPDVAPKVTGKTVKLITSKAKA